MNRKISYIGKYFMVFLMMAVLFSLAIPVQAAPKRETIVEIARAQVGKKYVWGQAGPDVFDCSGLVRYCWAQIGLDMPHDADIQAKEFTYPVKIEKILPGDLVFKKNTYNSFPPGTVTHVGIYVGDGYLIEAAGSAEGVVLSSLSSWTKHPLWYGAGRDPRLPSVERIAGNDRYETAVEISKMGWKTAHTVILARGEDFADALSGAPLAAQAGGPLLLTAGHVIPNVVRDEIKRLEAKEIIILGSGEAVGQEVVKALESLGIPNKDIHRLAGNDRYETSILIALKMYLEYQPMRGESPESPIKTAIFTTGRDYPDALSAASYAAYKKIPIILVPGLEPSFNSQTSDLLKKLNLETAIILGGNDVVSDGIEENLKSDTYKIKSVFRLYGDDRYATSRAIANYIIGEGIEYKNIFITTGENFPDGLGVAPLAGNSELKAPVLLVRKEILSSPTREWLLEKNSGILRGYIIGGDEAISETVRVEIFNVIN